MCVSLSLGSRCLGSLSFRVSLQGLSGVSLSVRPLYEVSIGSLDWVCLWGLSLFLGSLCLGRSHGVSLGLSRWGICDAGSLFGISLSLWGLSLPGPVSLSMGSLCHLSGSLFGVSLGRSLSGVSLCRSLSWVSMYVVSGGSLYMGSLSLGSLYGL